MRTPLHRNSIPASLKRACRCAAAFLLAASLVAPPLARAGIEAVVPAAHPSPITQFLYPPQDVYVLAIGINHYKLIDLAYSVKDTTAVSEAAARTFKNSSVHVVRLSDAEATKAKIHDALQQFALNSHASDLFIFSFSGFTFTKSKNGNQEVYLVPADTVVPDGCPQAAKGREGGWTTGQSDCLLSSGIFQKSESEKSFPSDGHAKQEDNVGWNPG